MVFTVTAIKFSDKFSLLVFLVTSYMYSFILPDGRFDVALLVPLLAPVLSLQHIIFPICRPYKGLYALLVIAD